MPDITMCAGKKQDGRECAIRQTCYRHKAKASDWQSFFSEAPFSAAPKPQAYCEDYWRLASGDGT